MADATVVDHCDLIIRGGTVFDGTGAPGRVADLAVRDGVVVDCGPSLPLQGDVEIDAAGQWVTPGFLDIHTHYDAEVEVMPGLEESVRHGVTTVVMGNCSLSTVYAEDEELVDLFCRVESLPRDVMKQWLVGRKTWSDARAYYDHLESMPLGPNVATLIGHSDIRTKVMGLERALTTAEASPEELDRMRALIEDALDAGYIGLSIDMLPWHRMDGEPYGGISIPSQQAAPHEYRALAKVVRRYGRVVQATPNALNFRTILRILGLSVGLGRRSLKTIVVAALDIKTQRLAHRFAPFLAWVVNDILRGNLRFQALAEPFLNYCDGVVTPLFEEFPTGVRAINASPEARKQLFADPAYRAAFRRDWERRGLKIFSRDLADMFVVASPVEGQVGKSFAAIAAETGADPLECFLDLLRDHDTALRWKTVVANDRRAQRERLLTRSYTFPGFNDSGAHMRNMAFHDGALQLLRQVATSDGMTTVEAAVNRITKQPADWLGIQAGSLRPGDRADIVVLDPEKLKTGLGDPVEHYDDRLHGAMRLVKRSDGVVRRVYIGGREAFADGRFAEDFGESRYGALLRAGGEKRNVSRTRSVPRAAAITS